MPTVQLPNNWRPRPYQFDAWAALERGCRRIALAWHRRAGKDDLCLHWTATAAMERVGGYLHMLPAANQARKAIWEAVNPRSGKRRIDEAFPLEIRDSTRESDMFIRFKNGSTWQVVGSDNYEALIGGAVVGVVFSEYALSDPNAWAFLRPILAENDGWALFISTPRGRNHFSRMIDYAKLNPKEWFTQVLTVDDTGAIPRDVIDREMREIAAERGEKEAHAIVQQEYYCDFDAALPGAYFGELMGRADKEKRIGVFPYLPKEPVGTAWDIGIGDSTVIWFYQQPEGGRVRLIDVLEHNGVGVEWYIRKIKDRPYDYAEHLWPHDGDQSEFGTGQTRKKTAGEKNLKVRILPRDAVDDGIQAVRKMLPLCEFNTHPIPWDDETQEQACLRMSRALDAMRQYRKEWDEKLQRFSDRPLHDWTSHTADGFRYLAIGRREFPKRRGRQIDIGAGASMGWQA